MIGETILHYKILEKLGEGGMGIVYKADDTKLKRKVAIKFLPHHISANDGDRKRFEIEAQAAASLNHPNIAQVYAIEEADDKHGGKEVFIVMELVDGKDLKDKIRPPSSLTDKDETKTGLPTDEAVRIATQIAKGLEAAHKKGIVHRDIKSQNIMITNDDNVKVMDFGLAKVSGASQLTNAGSTVGTIAYMSPEQANDEEADNRTDIWAFGVVFFELLTGHQPFGSTYEQAIIYSILNEEPAPITKYVKDCAPALEQIVNKCLEKNREDRYQDISEVLDDLELFEVDPDYGFRTKTLKIKKHVSSKSRSKKTFSIIVSIVAIIALSFLLPEAWQKIRDIAGWNTPPDEQHLVILPLMNIGGNPGKEAFCEGLLETLTSNLTQMEQFRSSLWVVPASEVIQNKIKSAGEAYKRYGVNLVVTGSVQFSANLIKLNLNLIDAKNLRQLNSSSIDVPIKEISSIDNKAIIKLLEMLHVEMQPQLKDLLDAGKTNVPEAYEYYVQGIGNLQRYESAENVEEAIRLLTLATKIDTSYALAYAGLGEAYWRYYQITKKSELTDRSIAAAKKGFILDSTLTAINITLGMIYNGTGKYNLAIVHFRRALANEPSDAAAFRGLAKAYQALNKLSEAEQTYKQAIKLKPDYWAGYNDLGKFYYGQSRYNDAIKQFKEVIKYTPDNYRGYSNVGAMYYMLEQWPDALKMFEHSLKIQSSYGTYLNLGTLYYIEGDFENAAKADEQALKINDNDYLTWGNLAAAYHWIPGRSRDALNTYKKAISLAEKNLKINPKDIDIISNLASYYSDVEDTSKSMLLLNKALELAPDYSSVLFRAASINEHFGNRDKALYWIKKALKNGYSRSEIEHQPELKGLISDTRYKKIVAEITEVNGK
ncbi:MAG: protein kinase [Ignavibacteriaceae bacterium]